MTCPIGLYSSGMHIWILDEMALGERVAHYLDSENNTGWTALHDLSYEQFMLPRSASRNPVRRRGR